MSIAVTRRTTEEKVWMQYPGARIIDVTSHAPDPWVQFSPFYPHGGIPVPNSPGHQSQSVLGVWQALKVSENRGPDPSRLLVDTMIDLKREGNPGDGDVQGHRYGLEGEVLLDCEEARRRIYLPAYRWVLENRIPGLVRVLRVLADRENVVLLDVSTNGDISDLRTPLSHAALLVRYLRDEWPEEK